MVKFDLRAIKASIDLPDGGRIVLLDWSKIDTDPNRNVFRLKKDGKLNWQVHSKHDDNKRGPFTMIELESGNLRAFRWNGLLYEIDLVTGFAVVVAVEK